jgi:hypothetical protein
MPNASALAKKKDWMSVHDVTFRRIGLHQMGAGDETTAAGSTAAAALGGCFNCAPGTPCDIVVEDSHLGGQFLCHNVRGEASTQRLCSMN